MISLKYGVEEGGGGLWKEIMKDAAAFREFNKFAVGNGRRISFLIGQMVWDRTLGCGFSFPIYNAVSKGAQVAEVWDLSGEVEEWNAIFLRSFSD